MKWGEHNPSPNTCDLLIGGPAARQRTLGVGAGGGPIPLLLRKAYLEELGCLFLEFLHLPLVLAGVERGGRRRAGAAAVGAGAHRLHRVEVLHARPPAAHPAARVLAQRPHDALAAAVGALRGHAHLVHVAKHLQERPW